MAKRLENLDVFEVSLVDKAANKRKFVICKSKEGGNDNMDKKDNELVLEVEKEHQDIVKSIVGAINKDTAGVFAKLVPLAKEESFSDILEAQAYSHSDEELEQKIEKMSDKAKRAIRMAVGALKGVKDEIPEDAMKAINKLSGMGKTEKRDYTAVRKNDDGSYDLSGIPEEMHSIVTALWKDNEQNAEKIKKQEKELRDAREKTLKAEFISKAQAYENIPLGPEKLGVLMKDAHENLSKDVYKDLEALLKQANEGIKVTAEIGTSGNDDSTLTAVQKAEHKAAELAKEKGITPQKAFVHVLDNDPELSAEIQKERQ